MKKIFAVLVGLVMGIIANQELNGYGGVLYDCGPSDDAYCTVREEWWYGEPWNHYYCTAASVMYDYNCDDDTFFPPGWGC